MVIPHARLARDRAGIVALAILTIGIAPRAWTVLTLPASAGYATFPAWAQALVLSAYAGQLGAEAWGGNHARALAAGVSVVAAGMVAALLGWGDIRAGGFPTWAAQASLQLWVCWSIARQIGIEHFGKIRVGENGT